MLAIPRSAAVIPMHRRQFLAATISAAGLAALPARLRAVARAGTPLRILVLGGTGFLGPHVVEHALARGHQVTLFNRGRTNADLFPELETIIGNRDPRIDEGLRALAGREWDAVIDNSGYVPRIVGASATLLADQTEHYVFVSTICQYEGWAEAPPGSGEGRARATLDDPSTEDVSTHYCELKAYCEVAADEAMPGRVTQIRPGLIVGPRDRSDRFTYWPVRIARGGEVLAPGKPADFTQFIDVRDLAAFMVHCAEERLDGPFNVVRPVMPIGELLDACLVAAGGDASPTWVPADFLAAHDLQAWRDLPAWVDADGPMAGSLSWSSAKALAAGLRFRPVSATVADTLAWFRTLPAERRSALRAGLPAEKEREVLAAWHAREKSGDG